MLLTISDCARVAKVKTPAVGQWLDAGEIPFITSQAKVNGVKRRRRLVREDDLHQFLQQRALKLAYEALTAMTTLTETLLSKGKDDGS